MNIYMDVDTALSEVPINILALTDDTDFKTREESVVYNQAGLDLVWNFITTAGVFTQTAVTPTIAGDYDWTNEGNAMYAIEIPVSGGASINNDTEGFGWFTGIATGILHWRGPIIGFRAAALNNALIDGGDILDVNITTIADTAQTANDNGADINAILIDTDTTIPGLIGALNDLDATETAAAIWNALLATYNAANSFGEKINAIGAIATYVDAILDEDITTHNIADSVAVEIKSHSTSTELSTHDGKLDTVDGIVDNILIDTGTTLPAEHDLLATEAKQDIIDTNVDSILVDTTRVDGLIEDSSGDRYTSKALEEAPSGTGGDATAANQTTILSNLATVDTIVDTILLDTGTDGVIVAAGSKTGYELTVSGIDDIWDEVIESTATGRQFLRILLAALAGKTTNGGTRFRDIDDTLDRIIVVTDASKNRTTITLNWS